MKDDCCHGDIYTIPMLQNGCGRQFINCFEGSDIFSVSFFCCDWKGLQLQYSTWDNRKRGNSVENKLLK